MEGKGNANREKLLELVRDNNKRFVMELEFLELLSNPFYLKHLAQNRYFEEPKFINYLDYLQYWKKPNYIKHVCYPHALYFLDLLQRRQFREKLIEPTYINLLWEQQYYHWRFHKHHRCMERMREAEDAVGEEKGESPNDQLTQMPKLEPDVST
uniref:Mediator of RNA polymerase II transcription subunit 31 n=1 Tax=Amorphochlora amoebiformis TaxID=1561963 RepID=A0A7S0D3K3_9EUKA|mmetsp:Transcript_17328/g.27554  ORF Transcript_17328/g.27554 Transcript_17328/m.27554 type:complete len:154 (+) Transcript_17328:113-574(+)